MKIIHTLSIFILIASLLSACGNQPPAAAIIVPTENPTVEQPSSTPLPTNTPDPTATTKPTKTPLPTNTPTPTIEPPAFIAQFLEGVEIISLNDFEKAKGWNVNPPDKVQFTGGSLKFTGATFWTTWGASDSLIKEGQGVLLRYSYARSSEFEFYLHTGQWGEENYRRFGIYDGFGAPSANLFLGPNGLGGNYLAGNLGTRADTEYFILMAVANKGDFISLIWEPGKPERFVRYRELPGEKFSGKNWTFNIGANKGAVTIDDFMLFNFDAIKK